MRGAAGVLLRCPKAPQLGFETCETGCALGSQASGFCRLVLGGNQLRFEHAQLALGAASEFAQLGGFCLRRGIDGKRGAPIVPAFAKTLLECLQTIALLETQRSLARRFGGNGKSIPAP